MLFQASAGKLRESGQEVWPDITFGQLELVTVLHLHQIQTERVGRHPASAANTSRAHSTGRSPAPMVISTPAMLRTM